VLGREPKGKPVLLSQKGLTIYGSGFAGEISANDDKIVLTVAGKGSYTVTDKDRARGWVDLDKVAWLRI
jgi:hypothetical protein